MEIALNIIVLLVCSSLHCRLNRLEQNLDIVAEMVGELIWAVEGKDSESSPQRK